MLLENVCEKTWIDDGKTCEKMNKAIIVYSILLILFYYGQILLHHLILRVLFYKATKVQNPHWWGRDTKKIQLY